MILRKREPCFMILQFVEFAELLTLKSVRIIQPKDSWIP
uniref:Uncharacterized protein n=1 Tax=Populus trichocarpa TaxID=3694 RepID=A0A3N7FHU4_POPTR